MKSEIDKNPTITASVKYGIITGVLFIVYFLLMKLLGLAHVFQLRYLNFLILIIMSYMALTQVEDRHKLRYLNGLGACLLLAGISYSILAIFMFIYLKIDTGLMEYYIHHAPMGRYLTPFYTGFWVANEGLAAQPIIALLLMEYIKSYRTHHRPV